MYTSRYVITLYPNPNPSPSPSPNPNANAYKMYCGGEKDGSGNSFPMWETGKRVGCPCVGCSYWWWFEFRVRVRMHELVLWVTMLMRERESYCFRADFLTKR